MRIEGELLEVGYGHGRAWVVVQTLAFGRETLPIPVNDYERCRGLMRRVITWDAHPEVEPVKSDAEVRAEETSFLVDALKARLGDLSPEEKRNAIERLGAALLGSP